MSEPRHIEVDISVDEWKVSEALAFRAAVGHNAEGALLILQQAFAAVGDEARAAFGDSVDADGWDPPEDWTPTALGEIDPAILLGFAWVHERRQSGITFTAFADEVPYGQLLEGFYGAMTDAAESVLEDAAAPLPNREQRRRPAPRSKTASPSATSSAGRSKKSAA